MNEHVWAWIGLVVLLAIIVASALTVMDRIEFRSRRLRSATIFAGGFAAFGIPFLNFL